MSNRQIVSKDLEHLKLLVTFHYVVAAITAICCSFPLIHVFIGLMALLKPDSFNSGGKGSAPPEPFFGVMFLFFGGAFVFMGWTLAALNAYAGRCISRREKHTFCLVVAGINCLNQPVGTALGIFTFIVLLRDSVKQLFEANKSPSQDAGWPPGSSIDR